ncbi:MAG: SEL1-like repeat protein [Undibacterium sp.]|nr:SEL1-like repeat protein [Opitutaceae bacterium]
MRIPAATSQDFFLTPRQRALLAAALLALGPVLPPTRAQAPDPSALRSRAESGDPDALNALGNAYANGQGVAQDYSEAVRLYELAAAKGHAPALFNLGMMSELGRGTPADLTAAFKRYLRAAELGFAAAQFNVGNMYANGIGVKRDFFEAALWFRQAADRAVPEAQYNLALAYELGRGVSKDETAAQKWYRAAAEQGYARARYNLALMLEDGRGSAPDQTAAAALYRAAAVQNFAPAQNNFGIMLAEGRGGLKTDVVEAYAWLALAVENGAKPVARDLLVRQLSAAQLATATARVSSLRFQLDPMAAAAAAPPAAATSTPTPAAPAPSRAAPDPQIAANQGALQKARAENARLVAENARLITATQAAQAERIALDQRLAAATAQATQAAQALAAAEATAKNAAARPAAPSPAELAALQAKLTAAQTAVDQAKTENARLLTENTRLTAASQSLAREKTNLDQRLTAAEAAAKTAAAKPVALAPADPALRAQLEQLQRDAIAIRADKESALRQVADLSTELKAARAISAAPASTVAAPPEGAPDNRLRSLVDDNARLNTEVKRATTELTTISRQLRQAQDKLSKLGPPLPGATTAAAPTDAETSLGELTRAIEELRATNEKLTADNRRLAAQPVTAPASDLAPQLTAAQIRVDQLTAAKAALEKRLAEVVARPAATAVDPAPLAKLQGDLTETQGKLVAARRETEEIRLKLDEAIDALAARTAKLTKELETAKAAAPQAAAVTEKLNAAQARVDQLVADKAALEKRLAEAATKPAVPSADPAQFRKLQGDLTETQGKLVAARRETEEIRLKLDEATDALAARTAKLTKELEAAKATAPQAAAATVKLNAAQNRVDQLTAEKALLEKRLADATAKPVAPAVDPAQLISLQSELTATQGKLTRAASEAEQLRQRLEASSAALAARTAKLTQDLEAAQAAVNAAAPREQATVEKLVAAQIRVDRLTADKAALEKQLADTGRNATDLGSAKTALADTRAAAAQARAEVTAAETERNQLARDLASVRAQLASQTVSHTALATDNQRLLAALQTAQKDATRVPELQTALTAAQADRAALNQLQTRLADAERAVARQNATAAELATAQEALAAARRTAEQARAAAAELTRTNAELVAQNQQLAAAAQTQSTDRDTLGKLNTQLDSAGKTIADLTAKNDELGKDLEVSKQSVAAALAAQAAAAKAAPEGAAMRLEMQTLQDQVTKLESRLEIERGTAAKELSSLAAQLQSTRETNRALTDANRALIGAKTSDDSVLRTERDQLDAKVRELTTAGTRLTEDKVAAERTGAEARKAVATAGQERDALRGQVDDMFSKFAEAERRLAQFKQSSDTGRSQLQIAQTEAEQARAALAAVQAKLTESDKALEQHNTTVAEITGLNDKLTREKAALATQLAAAQTAVERARADLTELKSRRTDELKGAEQQAATLATLLATDEKSTARLNELTGQVTTLRAENTRLAQTGDELTKLRAEAAETRRKLTESDQAGEQHATSVAELTGANEKLTIDKRDLQTRLDALSADLATQREQNARLAQNGQNADTARRDAEQRASQLATASDQLATAQRDLNALRTDNARLRESSSANDRERTARITQFQQENAAIAARLRQAQGTLDQIASAARLINGTVGPTPLMGVAAQLPVRTIAAPTPPAPVPVERFHTVLEGDSLTRISSRYYGSANRWQDIYDANRDVLKGENALRPGQRLKIP